MLAMAMLYKLSILKGINMKEVTQQGVDAFLEFVDSNDRELIPYLLHEFSDFISEKPVEAYRGVRYPKSVSTDPTIFEPKPVSLVSLSMSRSQAMIFADNSTSIGRRPVKFSGDIGVLYQAKIQGAYLNLHKLATYLVNLACSGLKPEGVCFDPMDKRLQLALTEQELIGSAILIPITQFNSHNLALGFQQAA